MGGGPVWGDDEPSYHDAREAHEARKYLAEGKQESLTLMRQAIRSLEEEIAEQAHIEQPTARQAPPPAPLRKVFVVHGHDEAALQAVARFLEQLKLDAIILREQPDQGRTIIEKFEDCASDVGFA